MREVLVLVAIVVAAFAVQFFVQRSVTSGYRYQCTKCGTAFDLTPLAATLAPHRFGGSKYARCPTCGSRSWVAPVAK